MQREHEGWAPQSSLWLVQQIVASARPGPERCSSPKRRTDCVPSTACPGAACWSPYGLRSATPSPLQIKLLGAVASLDRGLAANVSGRCVRPHGIQVQASGSRTQCPAPFPPSPTPSPTPGPLPALTHTTPIPPPCPRPLPPKRAQVREAQEVDKLAARLELAGGGVSLDWSAPPNGESGMEQLSGTWRLIYRCGGGAGAALHLELIGREHTRAHSWSRAHQPAPPAAPAAPRSSGFNSGSLGGRRPGPPAAFVPLTLGQVYQEIDLKVVSCLELVLGHSGGRDVCGREAPLLVSAVPELSLVSPSGPRPQPNSPQASHKTSPSCHPPQTVPPGQHRGALCQPAVAKPQPLQLRPHAARRRRRNAAPRPRPRARRAADARSLVRGYRAQHGQDRLRGYLGARDRAADTGEPAGPRGAAAARRAQAAQVRASGGFGRGFGGGLAGLLVRLAVARRALLLLALPCNAF